MQVYASLNCALANTRSKCCFSCRSTGVGGRSRSTKRQRSTRLYETAACLSCVAAGATTVRALTGAQHASATRPGSNNQRLSRPRPHREITSPLNSIPPSFYAQEPRLQRPSHAFSAGFLCAPAYVQLGQTDVLRCTPHGWHATRAVAHGSSGQQVRTQTERTLETEARRSRRRTLRRARRARAPRPALRVPARAAVPKGGEHARPQFAPPSQGAA